MIKKIGIEREFVYEKGKIIIGTVDKNNCKSLYIDLQTWLTPNGLLHNSIDIIRRKLKANMRLLGPEYIDNYDTYILNVEFNQTNDIEFKKSFVKIQLTIKSKTTFLFNNELIYSAKKLSEAIFKLLETLSDEFDMSPSKK